MPLRPKLCIDSISRFVYVVCPRRLSDIQKPVSYGLHNDIPIYAVSTALGPIDSFVGGSVISSNVHTYVPNCVNLMRMRPCLSRSLIPSLFLGFCICTRTSSSSPLPFSLCPNAHLSSEHPISSRKFGKVIAIISVGHAFTAHQSSRIGCTRETSMSLKVTQTRKTPRPPIDIFKFG
ncbi:hypothetical protein ACTXT7_004332 [Hymenolepis weldensis]